MKWKYLMLVMLLAALLLSGCLSSSLPNQPGIPDPGDEIPSDGVGDQDGNNGGSDATTYELVGVVRDETAAPGMSLGYEFQNGSVEVDGKRINLQSGVFRTELSPGTYQLRIIKDFYKTKTVNVTITKDTYVDIPMQPLDHIRNDLYLFAQIVHAEAKGESYNGKLAVAATILNRVRSSRYPNTLSAVIRQVTYSGGRAYYQYEPVMNGAIHNTPGNDSRRATYQALAGWDPTRGATGFFAHAKVPYSSTNWVWQQWNKDPYKIRIGNHSFFR